MKIYSLGVVSILLLSTGCATKGFVQKQLDPISCRVDVLENRNASLQTKADSLEARIGALESQVSQAQLANKAMLDEATATASASAQRAEAAAAAAEQAAQRTQKIFELNQKK